MYKRKWFALPSLVIEFLEIEKIKKENIIALTVDDEGNYVLFWEEVDSDASDD